MIEIRLKKVKEEIERKRAALEEEKREQDARELQYKSLESQVSKQQLDYLEETAIMTCLANKNIGWLSDKKAILEKCTLNARISSLLHKQKKVKEKNEKAQNSVN